MVDQIQSLPVIDIQPLIIKNFGSDAESQQTKTALEIHQACRDWGFFYVKNHGISAELQTELMEISREFFAQPLETKMEIAMSKGGRAWRGYFPIGDELTSGKPDGKEGIYFGTELDVDDHTLPLHGRNQFPNDKFRSTILSYMEAIENLGRIIMSGLARSLKLDPEFFNKNYFKTEPTCLFRIFNYPAWFLKQDGNENLWGVGEHTDYGMLTILLQDDLGGLQVKTSKNEWIEAPPIPNTFICNIGDMLERMTGGYYRSTLHRVRNLSPTIDRLSFPFFLDPCWDAEVLPIPMEGVEKLITDKDDIDQRWDKASVHQFHGTYGKYLLSKVSKVFPLLAQKQIVEKV
uniref:Fe2OG dioxygenase domain-containing protein n=1 Tax=Panagrolaimus sp. ES5 TaxID=591445 RepID=A0AC34FWE2_9BILA